MANLHFRPFATESYSGGGSFFNDGLYKVETARWVMYDFNGKAPGQSGNGLPCLSLALQPVNKDGASVGDAATQYWSIGTEEANVLDSGKDIELTGQFQTIWNLSDCGVFMTHLGTAKFDRSAAEEEGIAFLEGHVFEFGKVPSPRTQSQPKTDENGKPKQIPQIVVPTRYIGAAGKATGGKKGSSKAAAPANTSSNDEDANMELLVEFLSSEVLIDKNQKGVEKLQARMKLSKYLQQEKKADDATVKAVSALFNNNEKLSSVLNAAGWELSGSTIKLGS